MVEMNMIKALNSALEVQLTKDKNVVIFGEDVGFFGGVFPSNGWAAEEIWRTSSL